MKNIVIILTTLVLIPLGACEKEEGKGVYDGGHIDIAYKNMSGEDMLNPTTQNYYTSSDIHVFNMVDGVKKEVNYGNMDYPHNFLIYKNDSLNVYFLKVFIEVDTTLLELNSSITDTIICTIDKSDGSFFLRKVWYNGVLEWDNIDLPQTFTIVKQ